MTDAADGREDQPRKPILRVAIIVGLVSGLMGVAIGAGLLFAVGYALPPDAEAQGASVPDVEVVARVAQVVLPSVVRVDVRGIGTGGSGNASGVVIDDEGHIVTNNHVVAGATSISVTFEDGTTQVAILIGTDPATDLAVIQVDDHDHLPIAFAAPDDLRVGQLAVAVGSPFGLNGSVSAGVISAVDRPIDLRGAEGALVRLDGVVQTDAGINPGNSGGPLADRDGRMIGVNSAMLGEQTGGAVGFAIPIGEVLRVTQALIRDGRIPTPYLGLIGTTRDIQLGTDRDFTGGAVVQEVQQDGPADQAGLIVDDLIVEVDAGGPSVLITSMEDLVAVVGGSRVGATIKVTYIRDGAVDTAQVMLADNDGA